MTLYVSLDDIWFNNNKLLDLTSEFVQKGGKFLFLDEVHKYEGWKQELKNIYDLYPFLNIVFTGSSLLEIIDSGADLSRRAVIYNLQGFSFREYLSVETGKTFEKLSLNQILKNHLAESALINKQVKPFQYFESYLKQGYYPYYQEQQDLYELRVGQVINMIMEIELPLLRNIEIGYVNKLKQLLMIIAESVPFMPNVSKLSERIGINRATLLSYLFYLEEIELTRNLFRNAKGISKLQKPAKIYLNNTNLIFVLANQNANPANRRETFFANQVGYAHNLLYTEQGDFLINEEITIEIGEKNKTNKQIKDKKETYIAADNIEYGFGDKIPLWLFGFLY